MNIVKRLSTNRNHYKGVNSCKYITIHQTGNTKKGADAMNHSRYMDNGSPTTWHYTVDDKQVIQHFMDTVQCWHAGDGMGLGNMHSIGIELCINSDADYLKVIDNAILLVQHLMKKHNIPTSNVVQHNRWSGKHCPQFIRDNYKNISWTNFIYRVGKVTNQVVENVNNDTLIRKLALEVISGKHGNGDARKKSLGIYYNDVQKYVNNMMK